MNLLQLNKPKPFLLWNKQVLSIGMVVLSLILSSIIIFLLAKQSIVAELTPEIEKKTIMVGKTIVAPIERALDLGIELTQLRDVNDFLLSVRQKNEEIVFISIRTHDDKEIYNYQDKDRPWSEDTQGRVVSVTIPILQGAQRIGSVHIGAYLDDFYSALNTMALDTIIIILISLILTMEILLFVFIYRIKEPLLFAQTSIQNLSKGHFKDDYQHIAKDEIGDLGRALSRLLKKINTFFYRVRSRAEIHHILFESPSHKIAKAMATLEKDYAFTLTPTTHYIQNIKFMRFSLFLFMCADAFSLAIIPLFSKEIYAEHYGIPYQIAMALPIISFMVANALGHFFIRFWSTYFLKNYVFLSAGTIYCIGALGSACSYNFIDFSLWRMIAGLGFGLFLTQTQLYIFTEHTPINRVKNIGTFISAQYGAIACSTPMGAILSDTTNTRLIFVVGFIIALLTMLVCHRMAKAITPPTLKLTGQLRLSSIFYFFKDPNYCGLVFFIILPSRLLLSACLLYFIPFYLDILSFLNATIGYVMMLFALVIYALSYYMGQTNQTPYAVHFLSFGTLLAAASGLLFFYPSSSLLFLGMVIFLMGLGYSFSLTPQMSIGTLLDSPSSQLDPISRLALYRGFEMLGLALGPLLMSIIMLDHPPHKAIAMISGGVLVLHIIHLLFYARPLNTTLKKNVFKR